VKSSKITVLIMLLAGGVCSGQSVTPPVPTSINLPNPTMSSAEPAEMSTHETVSLATGNVAFFLPVASFPQRNGSSLSLGFVLDGNTYSMREPHNIFESLPYSQGDLAPTETFIQMAPSLNTMLWPQPIHTNLPTITADLSYAGLDSYNPCSPPEGNCQPADSNQFINWPEYCMQNWTFTDWDGSSHPFNGTRDCSEVTMLNTAPTGDAYWAFTESLPLKKQISQSVDDSYYVLDATNTSDIRVTKRDGTVYHFSGYPSTGYVGIYHSTQNSPNSDFTSLNHYSAFFSTIVDPNGNSISYANSVITDTIGRKINVSTTSIGYTAMNGQSTIPVTATATKQTATSTAAWPVSYPTSQVPGVSGACRVNYVVPTGQGIAAPQLIYNGPEGGSNFPAPNTYTITLQNGRAYSLTFDVTGNLTEITYPSGGYTKYDYIYGSGSGPVESQNFNDVTCTVQPDQLLAKHECSSSGGCAAAPKVTTAGTCAAGWPAGGEATTCYSGLYGPLQPGGTGTIGAGDSTPTVIDPYGNKSVHYFAGNFTYSSGGAGATSLTYHVGYYDTGDNYYLGQSTLLKSIVRSSSNSSTGCATGGNPWNLQPCTVTTSYSDTSPALSSAVQYTYDSTGFPNIAQIQEYDYSGNLIKTTNATWEHGGIYQSGAAGSTALSNVLDHVKTVSHTDATTGYTNTTTLSYDSLGNLQQSTVMGTGITSMSTIYTPLDPYGRPTQKQDPKGNVTQFSYVDRWSDTSCTTTPNSQAYLTSAKNVALNQTTYYSYDSCTGEVGSVEDPNNNSTNFTYDEMGRILGISYPDGGSETAYYVDTVPNSIQTTKVATPDPSIVTDTILDGFSRKVQIQVSDRSSQDYIDTTYDALGRVSTVSNAYRPGAPSTTNGTTQYGYDALGRKTYELEADGTSAQYWCYDGDPDPTHPQPNCHGNASSFTKGTWVDHRDEVGNDWQHVSDSAARLRAVIEPYSYETDYAYDGFDDLKQIDQWGGAHGSATDLQRTFTYDGLSRLLTAKNPETGMITYSYLASGALCAGNPSIPCSKTDARGVQTSYAYDSLNRLTQKSYSDGVTPEILYGYDGTSINFVPVPSNPARNLTVSLKNTVGRMIYATTVGLSLEVFSYDPMGRVANRWSTTPSFNTGGSVALVSAQYDLAGGRTLLTDSTGRTFNYSYDSAGRLQTASNTVSLNGTPVTTSMVNNMTYFPPGQPQTMTTDTGSATITGTWGVDNRLRVTSYQNLSSANTAGTNYGYSLTYTPNSNVLTDAETVYNPASGAKLWSWNFGYDNLNRLTSAQSAGGVQLGCAWTYDPFGNRLNQQPSGTGLSCTTASTPVNANNQLSNPIYSYDLAGDTLTEGGNTLTYDGEGRIATAGSTSYLYDGTGQRVSKTSGGVETDFIRDFDGTLLNTYVSGSYINQPQEMWIPGRHYGTIYPFVSNGVQEQGIGLSLTNWLGSEAVRSFTVSNGANTGVPSYAFLSLPFGDGQTTLIGGDYDNIHFTGKERDAESSNDYFGARYYASSLGRFMSPDWSAQTEPVPYAKLDNPQSLNLYGYGQNNPLRYVDIDGHFLTQGIGDPSNDPGMAPPPPAPPQSNGSASTAQQQTPPASTPNPNGSVPAPAPGKAPGSKPGDPLVPNEWVPVDSGKGSRDKWGPKYPIPGQSQPSASWDAPNGHWDNPDGKGNTTRYLPGGGKVDHWNNPIPMILGPIILGPIIFNMPVFSMPKLVPLPPPPVLVPIE
jgi:RHS repeat-associated protein